MLNRWKEHFNEILNRPEPEDPAVIDTSDIEPVDVDTTPIRKGEIKTALDEMKINKSPGPDGITADILKADPDTTCNKLVDLFKLIWAAEEVPMEWKQGIIVKLPKKRRVT